jgi:hypothetical protein
MSYLWFKGGYYRPYFMELSSSTGCFRVCAERSFFFFFLNKKKLYEIERILVSY